MKLLLDTHAFIWWDENPSKLGAAARRACSDPGNELILSTASVWEIQLKRMIGKLTLAKPPRQLLEEQARQNGLEISRPDGTHSSAGDAAISSSRSVRPHLDRPGTRGRLDVDQSRRSLPVLRRADPLVM